ncbi:MAG: hypothetical protein FRX48_05481 [Lasallia pustulata]|uniref:Uncharacterized protein n=1 Tax=Lasallia pustulata TaxID=136370 RepID=A0A5M8PNU9_9LECA|nr:MAG: hypothetical protein FRX48_05481 [Lasallia pustulata]
MPDNSLLTSAYHAQDFFDSDHPWIEEIKASQKQVVAQFICGTVRPGQSNETSGRQTRSKTKNVISWPSEWATDLPKLKQDIERLIQTIRASSNESVETHSSATSESTQANPVSSTRPLSHQQTTSKPAPSSSSKEPASMSNSEQTRPTSRGFTSNQRQELTEIIAQTVAATLAAQQSSINRGQSLTQQGERASELGAADNGGATGCVTFRAKDIGYFEPQANSTEDVIVKDRDMVYQNVFSFTNRVRVKATTVEPSLLRQNLNSCLLGQADKWYTEELSHIQRLGIRANINGVEEWCQALEQRF